MSGLSKNEAANYTKIGSNACTLVNAVRGSAAAAEKKKDFCAVQHRRALAMLKPHERHCGVVQHPRISGKRLDVPQSTAALGMLHR